MIKYTKIVCVLFTAILLLGGCTGITGNLSRVTLVTGGYGYEVGDIVLLDTGKKPAVGDIVQYDWNINKTSCMGFGPSFYLVKIIGLPGDEVTFQQSNYEANGYTVTVQNFGNKQIKWGSREFEDVTGMKLPVPPNEYLADKYIGIDCKPIGANVTSGGGYNRFTIKQEAITGVVLQKLGHDKEFEEEQKNIVY